MSKIRVCERAELKHLNDLVQIDVQRFNSDPSETSLNWFFNNPWIYTVIELNGKAEGYGAVIPINEFAHNALKRGDMEEDELKDKYILKYNTASAIYLASIATSKNSDQRTRRQLVGLIQGQLLRKPVEVFGIAVSSHGEEIAKELGMEKMAYSGPFLGIDGYIPTLLIKKSFNYV